MSELSVKVCDAIKRIKTFESIANNHSGDEGKAGYYLAFSGGKDSVALKALMDMAGVKYDAHSCIVATKHGISAERITEIARAASEGRLIVLPCKVGGTAYVLDGHSICKGKLRAFRITVLGLVADAEYQHFGLCAGSFLWGKDAFLTREGAEAELKEEA